MAHFAVNELTTFRWSFEEDVLHYASRGVAAIGVWRAKLAEFGVEKANELLAEQEMTVSSLGWAGGFTGSDGRGFRDSIHDSLDAIETAAALRAGCVIVYAGGLNGHIRRHARRLFQQALIELSDAAEALGVQLAIEPMHPGCAADWTFITDIRATLEMIGEIGSRQLGLVFDTYHLGLDDGVLEWLPQVAPQIRLVQLGDARHVPLGEQNRCLLGQGRVPIEALLATLTTAGYDGAFEIELRGEEIEHLDYEVLLDRSRAYFDAVASSVNV